MPFLHSSTIKPIILSMPILLTSFLLVLSQVSAVEGDYCEGYNENDPITIAVPGNASFKAFVNITPHPENPDQKNYSGFCIDVFEAALERLGCDLPFTYVEFIGTYDELVNKVSDKVFRKEYSQLAANVSKAILELSKQGDLKRLKKNSFPPNDCSQSQTRTKDVHRLEHPETTTKDVHSLEHSETTTKDVLSHEHSETATDDVYSLDLPSFEGIFLFSIATSTVCFLLFLLKNYIYPSPQSVADVNENNENVSTKGTSVS